MIRDLDPGLGHTVYRCASLIDLYLHARFQEIEEASCGQTDVCMNWRTCDTGCIRSTLLKSLPKKMVKTKPPQKAVEVTTSTLSSCLVLLLFF